jgi:hypothetical protein
MSHPKGKSAIVTEQLADLVVFPCAPGGGSITGVALPMDGAWTAR